ncbi:MAG: hypothetical protein IJD10_00710 [Clostridia bacterium]|nr:hypothetical protein [Clostridia bacterium]
MIEQKNKKTAGADERTPSRPQYFSWINNTNEGSTEAQTLTNLAYFKYLKDTYGMKLDIYALNAGNLDGASGTYETIHSPKIKAQYPTGYGNIARAAADIGARLGVWGGPDGFGDTEESAKARHEQMVSLCRDYGFDLFKFDGVCGELRKEYQDNFVDMMSECRKYSPDLILLNHRLDLGEEGMKHATTFLWEGQETYVDVHIGNRVTAPHHRAFIMDRGNTPDLVRLTEDHGVCISSCIDYFEDDLIIQAFGRCLILAPEIYGNPWLMRDDEQTKLARIYNLHRRYRNILIHGTELPDDGNFPKHTVVRGSSSKRFLVTGNMAWEEREIKVTLDSTIGLAPCEKVTVIVHHPYERYVGEFAYGDTVTLTLEPFRAALFEICDSREADTMLMGCEYEILHEDENGRPDRVKVVSSDGTQLEGIPAFDNTLRAPIMLGEIDSSAFAALPADAAKQLETALFVQDHDSLESRSLKRSGDTNIPEVKAAREAFFGQKTYRLRGTESRFAFDGKDDTFFDGCSKSIYGGFRRDGGCLRVDFGDTYEADAVLFEYFDPDVALKGLPKQELPAVCDYSNDLLTWKDTRVASASVLREETAEAVVEDVHNIATVPGRRMMATYPVEGAIRYFRMPRPLDRIHKIALVKDGREIPLTAPHANNLQPCGRKVTYVKELSVSVKPEDYRRGCYLAVCLEGQHSAEGAYAVLELDGQYQGAPDRAPGYVTNPWEFISAYAQNCDHHYTYYFPISPAMCGKDMTVRILGLDCDQRDYGVRVYLCDGNVELDGVILTR